ncbi:MAG: FAD-dependent oxidoreductase [Bryobacteraceae bacterium]
MKHAVIFGAGPAGLTAALELSNHHVSTTLLELDPMVGGNSRTVQWEGCRVDLGGLRFSAEHGPIERIANDVFPEGAMTGAHRSRTYLNGQYVSNPLQPVTVLAVLSVFEKFRCGLSYLAARAAPGAPREDLAGEAANRYGQGLGEKIVSHAEKVWGMPSGLIQAGWASPPVAGSALSSFVYPCEGAGAMWDRLADKLQYNGHRLCLQSPVEKIFWEPGGISGVVAGGRYYHGSHYMSTVPLRHLLKMLDPLPPPGVLAAAGALRYRHSITVALIVEGRDLFPDHWVDIADPAFQVSRIRNYTNWFGPQAAPDGPVSCLGLEYFCSREDALWKAPDASLLALARRELELIGLADGKEVTAGVILRVPRAHPICDDASDRALGVVGEFLPNLPNLQLAGRKGSHRNDDRAMGAAIEAARKIAAPVGAERSTASFGGRRAELNIVSTAR